MAQIFRGLIAAALLLFAAQVVAQESKWELVVPTTLKELVEKSDFPETLKAELLPKGEFTEKGGYVQNGVMAVRMDKLPPNFRLTFGLKSTGSFTNREEERDVPYSSNTELILTQEKPTLGADRPWGPQGKGVAAYIFPHGGITIAPLGGGEAKTEKGSNFGERKIHVSLEGKGEKLTLTVDEKTVVFKRGNEGFLAFRSREVVGPVKKDRKAFLIEITDLKIVELKKTLLIDP